MQTSKYQTPLSWAIWLIIASYQFQCKSPLDLSSPSYKLLRYPIMGLFPLPDSTQFKWISLEACQPPDLAQSQISRCFLAPFHWDASELSMVGVLVHSSRQKPTVFKYSVFSRVARSLGLWGTILTRWGSMAFRGRWGEEKSSVMVGRMLLVQILISKGKARVFCCLVLFTVLFVVLL